MKELPVLVVVALLLALGIKTFAVQAFYIPSGSMENTIEVGDRVLVDKFSPWFGARPERGEVIVFRDPGGWLDAPPRDDPPPGLKQLKTALTWVGLLPSSDEQDLIKRVIGVGGDTVACCDPSGRITVNGVPIDEPYLHPGDAPSDERFSVTVPKGRLWVMGDHRGDSADSRSHMDRPGNGTISEDDVVGRAFIVAWPLDRAHRLPIISTARDKAAEGPIPLSAPVVMGMVGAVPMVLLRRVRSRRRSPRARWDGGRSTDTHRNEEASWGKS